MQTHSEVAKGGADLTKDIVKMLAKATKKSGDAKQIRAELEKISASIMNEALLKYTSKAKCPN